MINYGFFKVAAASPLLRVADCNYNIEQIEEMMIGASNNGVQLLVFPELAITGYTCMDLFFQDMLIDSAEKSLLQLVKQTEKLDMITFIGVPLRSKQALINACVAFRHGEILGVVPKTYLPNSGEFQEKRWFTSSTLSQDSSITIGEKCYPMGSSLLFRSGKAVIGVDICEDLWVPNPPSSTLSMLGANIIINPSASNEVTGKHIYRKQLITQQSARCICGYVYAACGYGESTTDLVFAGSSLIAENGTILTQAQRFLRKSQLISSEIDLDNIMHDRQVNTCFIEGAKTTDSTPAITYIPFTYPRQEHPVKLTRFIDPHPFIPTGEALNERCQDIINIQVIGLAKRLEHTNVCSAVIGISGGLDSTLALLVTVMAFDLLQIPRQRIIGVTMPGFGTTNRTYTNAVDLIHSLDVTFREISISEATLQHFKDIGHDVSKQDITYENSQARERMQILMDIANMENGIVIGTGDLSELALGWATYNGDHMSMYGVNASIPKTLVKHLVTWIATHKTDNTSSKTLLDIVDTPISPELIPADADGNIQQKTEELVGPYELHDFFLYHFMRYGTRPAKIYYLAQFAFAGVYEKKTILKWLHTFIRRFFQQQFKRSCMPDGPKVGSISLSPRGDWRMPSDAMATVWLQEVESLIQDKK